MVGKAALFVIGMRGAGDDDAGKVPKLLLLLIPGTLPLLLLLFPKKLLVPALYFNWFNGGPFGAAAANGFGAVAEDFMPTPDGVKAKGFALPTPPPPALPESESADFFSEIKESKFTNEEFTPRNDSGDLDFPAEEVAAVKEASEIVPSMFLSFLASGEVREGVRLAPRAVAPDNGDARDAADRGGAVVLTVNGSSSSKLSPFMLNELPTSDAPPE